MDIAFQTDSHGDIKGHLQPPLSAFSTAASNFLDLTQKDVVTPSTIVGDADGYQAAGMNTLASGYGLWVQEADDLGRQLQARIDVDNLKELLIEAFTAVAGVLVLYLLVGFYRAVMRTVGKLDEAAQQLVKGSSEEVELDNRDELGQVARSFNTVARALLTVSAHNRAVLDAVADGIITIDEAAHIRSYNPGAERIFGYSEQEVLGQRTSVLMPDIVLEAGFEGHREFSGVRRNGEVFPMEVAVTETETEAEHEKLLIALVRDITQRKEAEQELLEAKESAEVANRAKSTFLANMSHELRTPLNAIIGYSEMLARGRGPTSQPQMIADLDKIHGAGKHLLALINDILDLSKIEAGKMELYLETFDVAEMVRDVVSTIRPLVDQKHNTPGGQLSGRRRQHASRPHQGPADPVQPAQQRQQVHRERHHHAATSRAHAEDRAVGSRSRTPASA